MLLLFDGCEPVCFLSTSFIELMWRETLPLLRAKRILKKKQTKSRSEVNDNDASEAKLTDNTTSVQQNQRTTKRLRRLLSMECLEEDNVTPSTPFPTDTASSTFPTIAAPSPLCAPIISAAPSIPPQDQLLLHYLREHLNEFTSNVDISASHRFNVLEHIACPNPSRPQQSHQKRCRMLMLQPTVNAKTEQLFQKFLVSSIASLVFPQSLPPPANDGSSFVAAAAESLPRVVQVHNTVREFIMDCNTCAVRGFDHRFVVNGTVGDIHVVTPPPPQKPDDDGRTMGMQHHHSSSRHQEDKHVGEFATSSTDCDMSHPSSSSPPPSLPADTAIVLEVKNSHALNHKMLAQALLEMELQKQLMCCQGRTYGPDDDNLSQAALLKRPLSNCPCTEAADTVLILWGSESCVITSSNRKTGERNIKKEDQIVVWVKAVHARLGERAEALLSRRAGNSRSPVLLGPPELDSYNILHHVRPLPRVNWAMQCADGSVLGTVSFEVLSLHPSITLPFGAADGMVGRGDRSIVTTGSACSTR
ncbi:Hypothetical protein, putative [Bodo saltans]|uniref:Uncharacterized protein n=1 Tax=Bodo saltans TaxID=75058 RepID=A0A0S4JDJ5_BODSA|nr:Hypothetical protein, putative [Bodo saltans]|eukprot:CUG87036.1 Hypothetical protein, putative [Bodo saltans]